ncbi:MFS transporter [Jatrophihabitans telluris]|uniref:MFS transporter n=1 Tax=Jatrophihabitans telluris TaxID=2038343 RepID=A0ABY4QUU8_9ACTN|nr:MFS transporter [Jatrophihabitans telluris]UQX86877.1 MFS transporter [Jatrophihabitans telluris]
MNETDAAAGAPSTPSRLSPGTLLAAAGAVAVAQIGLSIPAVINGFINQDLGTSSTQLTWISDAFLVPVTLLELSFGVVGDLFGRKRLLAIGAALMVVGGLIGFFTPAKGVGVLLTGQVTAGIGAAAIFPTSVAMLAAGTHNLKQRAHAISIWAAALTGAGFISPVLAGVLARIHHSGGQYASWRYAFLAMAVLAAVSAAITVAFAQNSSAPQGRSLDWPGQITVAISLFALLYAVIQGADDGWTSVTVIGGFVVAAVFMALFVAIERRVDRPLIRLELFSNRVFAISAVVTVIGMFAYLGTAYATSIRLSAIQEYTPLKTSIGFFCLNVMGVVLFPVSTRMIERYKPGWVLAAGMAMIGVGDLVLSAIPATNLSIAAVAVPLLVIGAGFKLAVTSITVVAVNSVPTSKAGMASGATSMLRDGGLTLGPAIVGAIALTNAAHAINAKIASTPALSSALTSFYASPQHVPSAERATVAGAVAAVKSGPLGQNGVPAQVPGPGGKLIPFNPLKDVAFHALSHGYAIGYLVCGISALIAALIAATLLGGRRHEDAFVETETVGVR